MVFCRRSSTGFRSLSCEGNLYVISSRTTSPLSHGMVDYLCIRIGRPSYYDCIGCKSAWTSRIFRLIGRAIRGGVRQPKGGQSCSIRVVLNNNGGNVRGSTFMWRCSAHASCLRHPHCCSPLSYYLTVRQSLRTPIKATQWWWRKAGTALGAGVSRVALCALLRYVHDYCTMY